MSRESFIASVESILYFYIGSPTEFNDRMNKIKLRYKKQYINDLTNRQISKENLGTVYGLKAYYESVFGYISCRVLLDIMLILGYDLDIYFTVSENNILNSNARIKYRPYRKDKIHYLAGGLTSSEKSILKNKYSNVIPYVTYREYVITSPILIGDNIN